MSIALEQPSTTAKPLLNENKTEREQTGQDAGR
jgi:hypothetical protein